MLAGVPFLGTLRTASRLRARSRGFRGILNGTSNFILSRMARDGAGFAEALAERSARRLRRAGPLERRRRRRRGREAVRAAPPSSAASTCTPRRSTRRGIARRRAAAISSTRPPSAARFARSCSPTGVTSARHRVRRPGIRPGHQSRSAASTACRTRSRSATLWSGELFFSGPGAGPDGHGGDRSRRRRRGVAAR